jgi:hypothetical protein
MAVGGPDLQQQLAEVLWRLAVGHADAPPLADQSEATRRVMESDAEALMPTVEAYVREQRAQELDAAAEALDTRAAQLWSAYKGASPADPRRASPYTEGESDGWENAGTALRDRAAALRAEEP